jgi:hypothetical protein
MLLLAKFIKVYSMFHRSKEAPLRTDDIPPQIYLVEGEHFSNRYKPKSMFMAVSREVGKLSVARRHLLLAGYHSGNGEDPTEQERTTTFALPYRRFRQETLWGISTGIVPHNTFFYAGISRARAMDFVDPTVGVYDGRLFERTRGMLKYDIRPGHTISEATLAEIHMVRADEQNRIPEHL